MQAVDVVLFVHGFLMSLLLLEKGGYNTQ
jgi:hypothetical protein